jgi:DNA-binding MarR family transcriptional regulator
MTVDAPAGAPAPDLGAASETDVAGRLFVALAQLTRKLRRESPTEISHGLVAALATVSREGPVRLGDLAATEGVKAPTMSRMVDALVADALVERVPDPADGRACFVRATAAGEELLSGARSARSGVLATRIARLDPASRAALDAALPALEALCVDEPAGP